MFDIPWISRRIKIRFLLICLVDNEVVGKAVKCIEKKSFKGYLSLLKPFNRTYLILVVIKWMGFHCKAEQNSAFNMSALHDRLLINCHCCLLIPIFGDCLFLNLKLKCVFKSNLYLVNQFLPLNAFFLCSVAIIVSFN